MDNFLFHNNNIFSSVRKRSNDDVSEISLPFEQNESQIAFTPITKTDYENPRSPAVPLYTSQDYNLSQIEEEGDTILGVMPNFFMVTSLTNNKAKQKGVNNNQLQQPLLKKENEEEEKVWNFEVKKIIEKEKEKEKEKDKEKEKRVEKEEKKKQKQQLQKKSEIAHQNNENLKVNFLSNNETKTETENETKTTCKTNPKPQMAHQDLPDVGLPFERETHPLKRARSNRKTTLIRDNHDEKELQRLVNNRNAARKFRKREKNKIVELEKRIKVLEDNNTSFRSSVQELTQKRDQMVRQLTKIQNTIFTALALGKFNPSSGDFRSNHN
ncbi:ccaat/enhancer binding protein [Anaeramoeba flamelloides]|uniref:Ccaat/enhancer binding protein n=1 Tax=Anaeramoeba flamelloides TaxID=1746091 RepID=A0ABQ8YGX0_9EUKA|nr:ccaat/enhancer binding protein [Anaeramoeba flamelloides]